jgi:TRAP-type C4-dicarboxylate transport system permease small subunit
LDRAYRAWIFLLERVFGYAAAAMMLGVTALAVIEIFRRYIQGRTFYWGQDAETYFLIAAAFLYFGATQARQDHLSVTALPDWLRHRGYGRTVLVMKAVSTLFSILFIGGFVYWGLPAADRTRMLGRMTESMVIPLWPFQYILLLSLALMGITMLFQFYRDVQALRGRAAYTWDTSEEGLQL